MPFEIRFWEKVAIPPNVMSDCWLWTESLDTYGYGHISRRGRLVTASRACYELLHEVAPGAADVLHSCDNRACVNPNHLRLGNARENSADMMSRGRQVKHLGEANGEAKLTRARVLEARARRAEGVVFSQIAKEFGVSKSQIQRAIKGESWSHI